MISAILLAAGQSKRMKGENKLTKKIQNVPLIKLSVKNILASSIDELIIVLGYQKEIIEKIISKSEKIKFVFNKDFESGMASSIKVGLGHISNTTEAFFICLGDMPMVSSDIYNQLIKSRNHKDILIPTYNGQQGNPVLFNKSTPLSFKAFKCLEPIYPPTPIIENFVIMTKLIDCIFLLYPLRINPYVLIS